MDYQKLCGEVQEIIRETAKIAKENFRKIDKTSIHFKAKNDLVSFVDTETEKALINHLIKLLPGSSFLAEESGKTTELSSDYLWIIDPIDGTTNYLHQLPLYSISVALQKNNETVLGLVYEVVNDEMFFAYEEGAFLNNKKISVSSTTELDDALLATGFPIKNFEILDYYLSIFKNLVQKTRGIRRMGTAAVDLAYVACGRFDGFFEFNLSPWDVAAGAYIVRQANGMVTDFLGEKNYLFGKQILASNAYLFEALLNEVVEK